MVYDPAPKRRRHLPLEDELQRDPMDVYTTPRRGLWSRWRSWRRRRSGPATFRGALALGLVRLAIAGGLGAAAAFGIAHLLGKDREIGFYIAGAAVCAIAFLRTAGDVETPYYYDQGEKEYRVSSSFSYILVGLVLIGVAVALETV